MLFGLPRAGGNLIGTFFIPVLLETNQSGELCDANKNNENFYKACVGFLVYTRAIKSATMAHRTWCTADSQPVVQLLKQGCKSHSM